MHHNTPQVHLDVAEAARKKASPALLHAQLDRLTAFIRDYGRVHYGPSGKTPNPTSLALLSNPYSQEFSHAYAAWCSRAHGGFNADALNRLRDETPPAKLMLEFQLIAANLIDSGKDPFTSSLVRSDEDRINLMAGAMSSILPFTKKLRDDAIGFMIHNKNRTAIGVSPEANLLVIKGIRRLFEIDNGLAIDKARTDELWHVFSQQNLAAHIDSKVVRLLNLGPANMDTARGDVFEPSYVAFQSPTPGMGSAG